MDNSDLAKSVEAVIKTLESITIPATFENLDRLLGCQQVLRTILNKANEPTEVENGDSDT